MGHKPGVLGSKIPGGAVQHVSLKPDTFMCRLNPTLLVEILDFRFVMLKGWKMDKTLAEALKDSVFDGRTNIDHGMTKNELEWHHRDRRTAEFKKATGLVESGAYKRAFGTRPWHLQRGVDYYQGAHNHGFDHTSLWRDREGRYIVTTEPYEERNVNDAITWCQQNGIDALRSQWPGMWYPWGNAQGSILILCSILPEKNGGDIHVVERCLLESFSERQ